MGKPSKSNRGGKGSIPAGSSGRSKDLRSRGNNRKNQVDDRVPASLVQQQSSSDEDDDDSDESGEGDEDEDTEEESEEQGSDDSEEEEEDLENVKIAVPVAMWVSTDSLFHRYFGAPSVAEGLNLHSVGL